MTLMEIINQMREERRRPANKSNYSTRTIVDVRTCKIIMLLQKELGEFVFLILCLINYSFQNHFVSFITGGSTRARKKAGKTKKVIH